MSTSSRIPKIVWSYWDNMTKLPDFYHDCISTWWKNIPSDWVINILDKQSLARFIDLKNLPLNFPQLIPQRQSDCIRLELLSIYGGVWMDVGIILNDNIENLLPQDCNIEYVGYYLDIFPSEPFDKIKNAVVENWFIASTSNYLIRQWRSHFFTILNQHNESNIRLSYPYKDPLTLKQIENFLYKHYLLMHVLYQYLLIHDKDFENFHKTKTFLRPAEKTALIIQSENNWRASKIKRYYNNYFTKRNSNQPLLKVRGIDFSRKQGFTELQLLIVVLVLLFVLIFVSMIPFFVK